MYDKLNNHIYVKNKLGPVRAWPFVIPGTLFEQTSMSCPREDPC